MHSKLILATLLFLIRIVLRAACVVCAAAWNGLSRADTLLALEQPASSVSCPASLGA